MEAHAASRSSAIIILFIYYGTGLCLLEWCGAVRLAPRERNSQAKEIKGALARLVFCGPGPIFDLNK
jgi:hypothetical protein